MLPGSQTAAHEDYLEGRLRDVLEALVEALLTTKPEDVHQFCIEWLAQWHREHDPEKDLCARLRVEKELLVKRRDALYARDPERIAAEAAEREKIERMKEADRRAGVSAPAVISTEKMENWTKPFYEKSQEVRLKIKGFILKNEKLQVLFGHLTEAAVFDVIDAMAPSEVGADADLITQGEEGDFFYIVEEGTFDVFVQRGDQPPGKVCEYGPGAMFGELALMYNARRAATVRATSSAKVWGLDRESFQMMLATSENLKKSQYEEFLGNIELFRHLTKYEVAQLSDLLEQELFDVDEDIMKQGDEGTSFYILEDGEAKVFIDGEQGEIEVKHYKVPGEFFGEVALLTNAPRRATVRAVGTGCSVLSVSVDDFNNVLGPIRDILSKNIDLYPSYADMLRDLPRNEE